MFSEDSHRISDKKQAAHTPGPWTVAPCSHGGMLLKRGMVALDGREVHPQHSLQIVPTADAILMSAAPEMKFALMNFVVVLEQTKYDVFIGSPEELLRLTDARRIALAAIAKAEGR